MRWAGRFGRDRQAQRDTLPLADLLPYLMCGSVGDFGPLHLLEDGALGYALEFDLPAVDTRVDGEEAISGLIDQALRALPDAAGGLPEVAGGPAPADGDAEGAAAGGRPSSLATRSSSDSSASMSSSRPLM